MDFPSDPFPSFKDWKAEYLVDWKENHMVTDADKAMEEADKLVAEADKELRKNASTHVKPKKKAKVAKIAIKKKDKTASAPSKKQRAIKVYQSMMNGSEHPSRKSVIEAFMSKVDMSQAGASTYHHNIKKELS